MVKSFIGWGYQPYRDELVNCGEFATVEAARMAVVEAGLELAEVETVWRQPLRDPRYGRSAQRYDEELRMYVDNSDED